MGSTRVQRPPAPAPAERARSIAARGGSAALVGTGLPAAAPAVHHVCADGSATLLLDAAEPLLDEIRAGDGERLPAMLEITDPAPVALREPARGLLWITGWLRLPGAAEARSAVLQVAEAEPHPLLLDAGSRLTVVRLRPSSAVLADAEGSAALGPLDLAAALPDPFCRIETHWLRHLEDAHPEVFPALARHLPPVLRDVPGTRVRPLGVDRCGLRLRVEAPDRDHDVRLAWGAPADTVAELKAAFARLVGCPMRVQGAGVSPLSRPRGPGGPPAPAA